MGPSFPDTNGVQAIFIPRANGNAKIVASWGGHPFTYEIDATNQTSGTGNQTADEPGPVDEHEQVDPGDRRRDLEGDPRERRRPGSASRT